MRRSIDQWRGMVPKAVLDGSRAQAMYCIEDAKADIIQLFEENERAAQELRRLQDVANAAQAWRGHPIHKDRSSPHNPTDEDALLWDAVEALNAHDAAQDDRP